MYQNDFSRRCLTPDEISKGNKCPSTSVAYLLADGIGEYAQACTSPANRARASSMLVAALSAAVAGFLLCAPRAWL